MNLTKGAHCLDNGCWSHARCRAGDVLAPACAAVAAAIAVAIAWLESLAGAAQLFHDNACSFG